MLPVVAGLAVLYSLGRSKSLTAPLLVAYYLLAFLFGGNPLIVSWIIGNTGGTTKKSILMSLYNAGSSAGNIVGPLLFSKNSAPAYHPGLRSVLAIFVTLIAVTGIQFANLWFLNSLQRKKRVKNGKPADLKDSSMEAKYTSAFQGNEGVTGEQAFLDMTDRENDEFIYVY